MERCRITANSGCSTFVAFQRLPGQSISHAFGIGDHRSLAGIPRQKANSPTTVPAPMRWARITRSS